MRGGIVKNEREEQATIEAWIKTNAGWQLTMLENGVMALEKNFSFLAYNAAIGFIMRVALIAERSNHHPNFHNLYKDVRVCWSSHAAGGITKLDFELAKKTDDCAAGLKA